MGDIIRAAPHWLRHLFADGGYASDKRRDAHATLGRWTIEIIKRCLTIRGRPFFARREGVCLVLASLPALVFAPVRESGLVTQVHFFYRVRTEAAVQP